MGKNNKSIQILRGSSTKINENKSSILPGQPVYDKTNNYLYVGQDDSTNNLNNPVITNKLKGKLNTNRAFEFGPSNDHITLYSQDSSNNAESAFNIYTYRPETLITEKKVHRTHVFNNESGGDKTVAINLQGGIPNDIDMPPAEIKYIQLKVGVSGKAIEDLYKWVDDSDNVVFDIFDSRQIYLRDPIFTPRLNLANQSPTINFIDASDSKPSEWIKPAAQLAYGATGSQGYLSFKPIHDDNHIVQFSVGDNGTSVEIHSKQTTDNNNIALITNTNDPPKIQFNYNAKTGNIIFDNSGIFTFNRPTHISHYVQAFDTSTADGVEAFLKAQVGQGDNTSGIQIYANKNKTGLYSKINQNNGKDLVYVDDSNDVIINGNKYYAPQAEGYSFKVVPFCDKDEDYIGLRTSSTNHNLEYKPSNGTLRCDILQLNGVYNTTSQRYDSIIYMANSATGDFKKGLIHYRSTNQGTDSIFVLSTEKTNDTSLAGLECGYIYSNMGAIVAYRPDPYEPKLGSLNLNSNASGDYLEFELSGKDTGTIFYDNDEIFKFNKPITAGGAVLLNATRDLQIHQWVSLEDPGWTDLAKKSFDFDVAEGVTIEIIDKNNNTLTIPQWSIGHWNYGGDITVTWLEPNGVFHANYFNNTGYWINPGSIKLPNIISSGTVTATRFQGTADLARRLRTQDNVSLNVGSAYQPVYFQNGIPVACSFQVV